MSYSAIVCLCVCVFVLTGTQVQFVQFAQFVWQRDIKCKSAKFWCNSVSLQFSIMSLCKCVLFCNCVFVSLCVCVFVQSQSCNFWTSEHLPASSQFSSSSLRRVTNIQIRKYMRAVIIMLMIIDTYKQTHYVLLAFAGALIPTQVLASRVGTYKGGVNTFPNVDTYCWMLTPT